MFKNIWFLISGFFIGAGFRVMYFLVTGKDIPLLKFSYKTLVDGTIEFITNGKNAIKRNEKN
jgi:hypothetical protein